MAGNNVPAPCNRFRMFFRMREKLLRCISQLHQIVLDVGRVIFPNLSLAPSHCPDKGAFHRCRIIHKAPNADENDWCLAILQIWRFEGQSRARVNRLDKQRKAQ